MRGEREDKRRAFLSARRRCWGCCDSLEYDELSTVHYCAKCRATAEAEVWRLHCEGEDQKVIAEKVGRAPSTVHEIVRRLDAEQADTNTFARNDGIPRCRCGLRIDKDHLVCDLYGAAGFANNRSRPGPVYPR